MTASRRSISSAKGSLDGMTTATTRPFTSPISRTEAGYDGPDQELEVSRLMPRQPDRRMGPFRTSFTSPN